VILRQSSVTDEYDRPVPGATIYVFDTFTGVEATLTSDGVTPLAQPVTTDEFGIYTYYADEGVYREDTWFAGKLRFRQADVILGNPVGDLALRSDLAQPTGPALVGLGNGSTLSDVIRINAASYGFRPGRTAAQNLTALTNAIGAAGGGAHPLVIDIPPATYNWGDLGVAAANVWIDAHGSTFLPDPGSTPLSVAPSATGFKMKNGRFYVDTANAIITLNSSGGGLKDIDLVKYGTGDGYMMVTEGGVTDNVYDGLTLSGGNGIFIEGERLLFNNIHGVGRAAGGDDFLVLKARNRRTGDINIGTVCAKNYANGVAMGGEVGTLGAASAGRAGRVENVKIGMMELSECQYGIYFKPGAVDAGTAYDWRDGLIRGVDATIKIADGSGNKMRRGVVISPARNALVEFPKINLVGEGRFANSADDECWAQIYLPDSTGWVGGGAGGIVRDVELDIVGDDIYDGVDNDGSHPGYPPLYGVSVVKQSAGVGTVDRIRVRARINGTKGAGVQVSAGCDNAVHLERLIGRNLAVNPPATTGGIHAESIMRAPGENEISMANSGSKPVYVAGTGDVIGKRITVDLNTAAGVDQTLLRQLPHDAWLRKVSGVPKDTVGASGTVYLSIELRAVNGLTYDGSAQNGNPLTTFTTQGTALTAFTPFDFPAMPVNLGGGASFVDRFLRAGAVLRVVKTNTGGGQAYVGSVDIHYVQIGRAS